MSPLDIPMFVNMMTDMLLTIMYVIPSAKYNVGIQLQGDLNCFILLSTDTMLFQDNNVLEFECMNSLWKP